MRVRNVNGFTEIVGRIEYKDGEKHLQLDDATAMWRVWDLGFVSDVNNFEFFADFGWFTIDTEANE